MAKHSALKRVFVGTVKAQTARKHLDTEPLEFTFRDDTGALGRARPVSPLEYPDTATRTFPAGPSVSKVRRPVPPPSSPDAPSVRVLRPLAKALSPEALAAQRRALVEVLSTLVEQVSEDDEEGAA